MSRLFNEKEKTKMINQYLKKTSILSSAPRLLFRTFAARGASGHGWYHKFKKDFAKGESDPVPFPEPINNVERKKVYMELDGIEDLSSTKITFELCNDIAPKTCENFMKLCTHDNGHGYKGTIFHQILKNEVAVGGDIDGKGGVSSLVKLESGERGYFQDESFMVQHSSTGVLSMVSSGVDQNASQFLITLGDECPHLNGRHVAFGRVVEGMEVLEAMNKVFAVHGKPLSPVVVKDCGTC